MNSQSNRSFPTSGSNISFNRLGSPHSHQKYDLRRNDIEFQNDIDKWCNQSTKFSHEEQLVEVSSIAIQESLDNLRKLKIELDSTAWMFDKKK